MDIQLMFITCYDSLQKSQMHLPASCPRHCVWSSVQKTRAKPKPKEGHPLTCPQQQQQHRCLNEVHQCRCHADYSPLEQWSPNFFDHTPYITKNNFHAPEYNKPILGYIYL
jgi:hypothetical protein